MSIAEYVDSGIRRYVLCNVLWQNDFLCNVPIINYIYVDWPCGISGNDDHSVTHTEYRLLLVAN